MEYKGEDIIRFLRDNRRPRWLSDALIFEELKEGDRLADISGTIEIDNINIGAELQTTDEIPYQSITEKFDGSPLGIIFAKKTLGKVEEIDGFPELVVPFSALYNAGIGICNETSILTQLIGQRNMQILYINGELSYELKDYPGTIRGGLMHAFNLLFKDNVAYLIDNQNPIKKIPFQEYIVPVLSITDEGRFQVAEKYACRRSYSIRK